MSQVFLSYASADRDRAKRLADAMQRFGYQVWWDRQIAPGRSFDEVIEEALNRSACVVVLWSATSVTSQWVKTEAAEAASRQILVPARIDDVKIPLEFRRVQAADLTRWSGDATDPEFRQFLRAVDDEIQAHREALAEAPTVHGSPVPAGAAPPVGAINGVARNSGIADGPSVPPPIPVADLASPSAAPPGRRWQWALGLAAVVVLAGAWATWTTLGNSPQVPSVTGMTYEQAVIALTSAGMSPERHDQPSGSATPGTVVTQNPAPGTALTTGATISLTVAVPVQAERIAEPRVDAVAVASSDGPAAEPAPAVEALATVPDLQGQTVDRAAALLAGANLTVGGTTEVASNDVTLGTVTAQAPTASQTIAKGSVVQLTVATRRLAPELVGRNLKAAEEALTRLGLMRRIERVRAAARDTDETVVKQTPAAGSELDAGGEVALTIAIVTPKRIDGGESLFRTGGQRCRQVCTEAGLKWTTGWSGSANTCTCDF
jgi:beta-lactam-binding protein with PASTA domain